jgi:hypothetical protein
MGQVTAYFDGSGDAGPVASADGWAALGAWVDQQDVAGYPRLYHLWERGWEDDLDGLLREARRASPEGRAREALAALAECLEGRAEGDSALALGLDDATTNGWQGVEPAWLPVTTEA